MRIITQNIADFMGDKDIWRKTKAILKLYLKALELVKNLENLKILAIKLLIKN